MSLSESAASRRALLSGALGLGGLAALAPSVAASTPGVPQESSSQYFLKLDGVKGESIDDVHSGEIDLLTWGMGVDTVASPLSGSGGAATGKSKPEPFVFLTRTGKVSPKLYQLVCTGKHLKSAVLTVRRYGEPPQEYLKVTMQDILISSYQVAPGENDGYPVDVGELSFRKITYSYRPQREDGQLGDPITFGFDFAANKAI